MARQLLVESIRTDGHTQSREKINEETVAEYAEAMKETGSWKGWPPVTVYFDGTEYWLADGFHRVRAAQSIGRKNIPANVIQGSREDATWASTGSNVTHGLRRTPADKRRATEMAVKLRLRISDEGIGRHVGVSREFVLRVRHALIPQPVIGSQVETKLGVDGKMRSQSAPKPKTSEDQEDTKAKREGIVVGSPPPASKSAPPPEEVPEEEQAGKKAKVQAHSTGSGQVDDMGRRIPDFLEHLWSRRQEVQEMLSALSKVRVALRKAQDCDDPLFSEVPFSSALAHLDQAYDAVQVAKPYAVCAFCQGHGCKACGKRGLLGKFRWDVSVPKEHKEAVARIIDRERSE